MLLRGSIQAIWLQKLGAVRGLEPLRQLVLDARFRAPALSITAKTWRSQGVTIPLLSSDSAVCVHEHLETKFTI